MTLDWSKWAQAFAHSGLHRLRTELVGYTVVDVHGRTWTVRPRHRLAEIDLLVRQGLLRGDYADLLDEQERQHAAGGARAEPLRKLLVAALTTARIRRVEAEPGRPHGAPRLLSLRSLLAQVSGNPGVTLEQLRRTALPIPPEQARAVLDWLAALGMVCVGPDGRPHRRGAGADHRAQQERRPAAPDHASWMRASRSGTAAEASTPTGRPRTCRACLPTWIGRSRITDHDGRSPPSLGCWGRRGGCRRLPQRSSAGSRPCGT